MQRRKRLPEHELDDASATARRRLGTVAPALDIQETVFGTCQLNGGFQLIGRQTSEQSSSVSGLTPLWKRIAARHYPLNLDMDTRYLTCYEHVSSCQQLYMIVAEIQQNVMDWASEELLRRARRSFMEADWPKLGLETFTDRDHGLYSRRYCDITVDSTLQTIRVVSIAPGPKASPDSTGGRSKPRRQLLVTEGLTPPTGGDDASVEIYCIQWGMHMLSAACLHLATSTKSGTSSGDAQRETNLLNAESASLRPPLAGGHGVGLKQSLALFAARGWRYQVTGTIPNTGGRAVAQWSAVRAHHELGVHARVEERSSLQWPATWPADVLRWLTTSTCPFLCTVVRLSIADGWSPPADSAVPSSSIPVDSSSSSSSPPKTLRWQCTRTQVWNALVHSNITFVQAALESKSRGAVHVDMDERIALFPPHTRVSAHYLNGTPCWFTGMSVPRSEEEGKTMLHVLHVTEHIRDFSKEERAGSARIGVDRILQFAERTLESPVRGPSGDQLSAMSTWPPWLTALFRRAADDDQSPAACFLFQFDSGRLRRAAAAAAGLSEEHSISGAAWKSVVPILTHLSPPWRVDPKHIVDTEDAKRQRFYNWIQRDCEHYGWDSSVVSVDEGFHFADPCRRIRQHWVDHVRLTKTVKGTDALGCLIPLQQIIASFAPYVPALGTVAFHLWPGMSASRWQRPLDLQSYQDDSTTSTSERTTLMSIDSVLWTPAGTADAWYPDGLNIPATMQPPNVVLYESAWKLYRQSAARDDEALLDALLRRATDNLVTRNREMLIALMTEYIRALLPLASVPSSSSSSSSSAVAPSSSSAAASSSSAPPTSLTGWSLGRGRSGLSLHSWIGQWMSRLASTSTPPKMHRTVGTSFLPTAAVSSHSLSFQLDHLTFSVL